MLIFGNIDLLLVLKYPGIRFVWGPSCLEKFIGENMMRKLLCNSRFRLISLIQGGGLYDHLVKEDPYFQRTIISEGNSKINLYCLRETPNELIKHYMALKYSLPSKEFVELIYESPQNITVKIENEEVKVKQKRKREEQKPENPHPKKSHTNVYDRVLQSRINMLLQQSLSNLPNENHPPAVEDEDDDLNDLDYTE